MARKQTVAFWGSDLIDAALLQQGARQQMIQTPIVNESFTVTLTPTGPENQNSVRRLTGVEVCKLSYALAQ
jgi:hypothetical protein